MSDEKKPTINDFDHPCKETCSGWKQGFDRGKDSQVSTIENLTKKLEASEESARFYRREWESACERAQYAKELQAEVARLTVERDEARESWKATSALMNAHYEDLAVERERLRIAMEALEYYGDRRNCGGNMVVPNLIYETAAGGRARTALERIKDNASVEDLMRTDYWWERYKEVKVELEIMRKKYEPESGRDTPE